MKILDIHFINTLALTVTAQNNKKVIVTLQGLPENVILIILGIRLNTFTLLHVSLLRFLYSAELGLLKSAENMALFSKIVPAYVAAMARINYYGVLKAKQRFKTVPSSTPILTSKTKSVTYNYCDWH